VSAPAPFFWHSPKNFPVRLGGEDIFAGGVAAPSCPCCVLPARTHPLPLPPSPRFFHGLSSRPLPSLFRSGDLPVLGESTKVDPLYSRDRPFRLFSRLPPRVVDLRCPLTRSRINERPDASRTFSEYLYLSPLSLFLRLLFPFNKAFSRMLPN